ncbi:YfcC family protein [Sinanaerobacter sp. ZZT-01]|uniref:YfcC family protein n=1 Tax=Sinanaerobacter sp. ZZT-01 TaxID=3111540 RepID=UPI002D771334|nr:AbgT family transporter [Sinanaerobacter sp. ZZT-01]WRR93293.1 AbgT family transporter [Sinanaerobacter sp. ZZT-01]
METKKKLQVPHVYILLIGIILVCSVLTYIIPAGQYQMMTLESGREVVDPSSFQNVENTPVNLMGFLTSIPRGMVESASIIFFIFIVGGSFTVLQDTGAIEAGLGRLTKALSGSEIIIIPAIMIAFSLGGAIIGMAEETLPFIPIMVSLAVAMGFDSMTGTAMVLCGAGCGFAGAFMNPFTIGVAQGIAGLPLFSGMTLRIALYICMLVVTITFVILYARKVKKDPKLSSMYDVDVAREDKLDLSNLHEFGGREKLILLVFAASIVLLIYGVIKYGWYMNEIAALFLGMAMIVAAIGRLGFNGFANSLGKGMADVAAGALIVGFARGILVVMTDGNIIHPILYGAATFLGKLPAAVTAVGMYIFQCFLNFIVPSGSGQAAVSIPIMAPLADLVGVTRQTACLAFQLGDGISNIFTPTSGYFMAGLALAKIPWTKWAKWILPLICLQYTIGAIFVIIAQMTNFGPF